MRNHASRSLVLLILLLAAMAAQLAWAQSSSSQRNTSSPGRYRSQGAYRSQGSYRGSQPWRPSYHHQNKYYQVKPLPSPLGPPFVGSLSRSNLLPHGGYSFNIAPPAPVLPGYSVYVPHVSAPQPPPASPPQAPAPQVYVVQPPVVQQAPVAQQPSASSPAYEPPPSPVRTSNEPGELALSARPTDTRLHLNGRFVGTGESLSAKGEPLVLRPGVYVLEAEHPDYPTQRLIFGVTPEETVRVAIDLTADRPGRRAWVETDEEFLLN